MSERDPDRTSDPEVARVSDALVEKWADGSATWRRLRRAELRLLVDVSRRALIVALTLAVFAATVVVGAAGPYGVQQFLLDGTSIANSYVGVIQGVFTAIVVVMSINQLVLQGKVGPLDHQRERLDAVLEHRDAVEERAGLDDSPASPSGFLRTTVDGVQERLRELEAAADDCPVAEEGTGAELDDAVTDFAADVRASLRPVDAALAERGFSEVAFLGAAIHWNVARDLRRVRALRSLYGEALDDATAEAFEDVEAALKAYEVTREYFRVQYMHLQFVRFTHAVLLTGLPALLVSHYATGILGPGVLPGTTLGVANLLWLESALFAITMLPVVVITAYVARIATLSLTSVFPGPFELDVTE